MEQHTSVLLQESVEGLALKEGDVVIDATLGLGGHTEEITKHVRDSGIVLAIDADETAIAYAKERLQKSPTTIHFALGTFGDMKQHADALGIAEVNGVLFDLGWNSTQLERGRGFSFQKNEPLIMTYSATPGDDVETAHDIVNTWSEKDLEEILRVLGEEKFSRRIARAIVEARQSEPIQHAKQLADVVYGAVPVFYRKRKIHPATKTFQALRMAVNNELSTLTSALDSAFELLKNGGRIAVITFHSIEDGLVKRIFRSWAQNEKARLIVKKPLTPSQEEINKNPRSRSAKLRIIEKI